jgi:hypothetical protein
MADKTLGVVESKFADIIWSKEPLSSSELSKLAEKELGWKAQRGMDEMCRDIWNWQSNNPDGFED